MFVLWYNIVHVIAKACYLRPIAEYVYKQVCYLGLKYNT